MSPTSEGDFLPRAPRSVRPRDTARTLAALLGALLGGALAACEGGADAAGAADASDGLGGLDATSPADAIPYEIPGVNDPEIVIRGLFLDSEGQAPTVEVEVEGGELAGSAFDGKSQVFTVRPGSARVRFSVSAPGHVSRYFEVRGNRELGPVPLFRATLDLGQAAEVFTLRHDLLLVATAGRDEGRFVPYGYRQLDAMPGGTYLIEATDDPTHPALTHIDERPFSLVGHSADLRYALLMHSEKGLPGRTPSVAILDTATGRIIADGPLSGFSSPPSVGERRSVWPMHGPTGRAVASVQDGALVVFELGRGTLRELFRGPPRGAPVFSPDGRFLAALDPSAYPQTLVVIDLSSGVETPLGPASGYEPAFAADGSLLATILAPGSADCSAGCTLTRFTLAGQPTGTPVLDGVRQFWPLRDGNIVVQGDAGFGNIFEVDATGARGRDYIPGTLSLSVLSGPDDLFLAAPGLAFALEQKGGARTDFSAAAAGAPLVFWEPHGVDVVVLNTQQCTPCTLSVFDPATRSLVPQEQGARADGLLWFWNAMTGEGTFVLTTRIGPMGADRALGPAVPGVTMRPLDGWPETRGHHAPCLPYEATGGGDPSEAFCVAD